MPSYRPNQVGTGFVDFGRVFDLNRDASQRMAGQLGGQIEAEGQRAQGALEGYRQRFGNAVAMGRVSPEYSGPETFAGFDPAAYESARQGADDAGRTAQLGSTTAGRAALLTQGRTGPYSRGSARLDAALAGAGGGGRFEGLSAIYGGLGKAFGLAETEGASSIARARQAGQYGAPEVTPVSGPGGVGRPAPVWGQRQPDAEVAGFARGPRRRLLY